MCEKSLNVQSGPERPTQQQIWMWESANAPTLINEVRKEIELRVLQACSPQKIYLEKLLCWFNGDVFVCIVLGCLDACPKSRVGQVMIDFSPADWFICLPYFSLSNGALGLRAVSEPVIPLSFWGMVPIPACSLHEYFLRENWMRSGEWRVCFPQESSSGICLETDQ